MSTSRPCPANRAASSLLVLQPGRTSTPIIRPRPPGGTQALLAHCLDVLPGDRPPSPCTRFRAASSKMSSTARAAAEQTGLPPKVEAWLPGPSTGRALLVHKEAAHGQAAGDALGEGDGIGPDAVLLEGEEGAGAADAGLHLVHQQQPVPLLAQAGQGAGRSSGSMGSTPPSPWTSSSSTAHTSSPAWASTSVQIVGAGVAEALR